MSKSLIPGCPMAGFIPLYSVSSRAEIERRARELFERGGRAAGRDLEYWLQAEADYLEVLRRSHASLPATKARCV